MKFNLYIILLSCTVLVGCALGGSQRYKAISAHETSTIAVVCEYQSLCESKEDYFSEYRKVKEMIEGAFASRGFRVVPFKALDQSLDYVVVLESENEHNGDFIKTALVDYRSREIAGRMSYVPLSAMTRETMNNLVEEMLKSPIVEPDFDVKLK